MTLLFLRARALICRVTGHWWRTYERPTSRLRYCRCCPTLEFAALVDGRVFNVVSSLATDTARTEWLDETPK